MYEASRVYEADSCKASYTLEASCTGRPSLPEASYTGSDGLKLPVDEALQLLVYEALQLPKLAAIYQPQGKIRPKSI